MDVLDGDSQRGPAGRYARNGRSDAAGLTHPLSSSPEALQTRVSWVLFVLHAARDSRVRLDSLRLDCVGHEGRFRLLVCLLSHLGGIPCGSRIALRSWQKMLTSRSSFLPLIHSCLDKLKLVSLIRDS